MGKCIKAKIQAEARRLVAMKVCQNAKVLDKTRIETPSVAAPLSSIKYEENANVG